jgi:hypothetical protein
MQDMEDHPVAIFRVGVQSGYGQAERKVNTDGQSEAWDCLYVPIEKSWTLQRRK